MAPHAGAWWLHEPRPLLLRTPERGSLPWPPYLAPACAQTEMSPLCFATRYWAGLLLRKAPGLEAGFLPVEGRNKVIFRRAAAPPQPERLLALPALVYTPQSVGRANRKFRDGQRASG